MSQDSRVAICHEWITTYGGSEQVARQMAEALNAERIYTFTAERKLAAELFPARPVTSLAPSALASVANRHWQWFLPLMPLAWARADLSNYDAVLTSSHSSVNAIRVAPQAVHISYCHTPMRYAWEWKSEIGRLPAILRPLWPSAAAILRKADRGWAQRVTRFIANSKNVAARIGYYYSRDADVLYPPIDTTFWTPGGQKQDFFLFAGRLVSYKRADIAVSAATALGIRLVVAGSGPRLDSLRRRAGPNVSFAESPTREQLRNLYREAAALLFPGIEDFGMTLVEAQACGTPVIAYARGGALEAVVDGMTGYLYQQPGAEGLVAAIKSFDPSIYAISELRAHAESFATPRFDASLRAIVDRVVAEGK